MKIEKQIAKKNGKLLLPSEMKKRPTSIRPKKKALREYAPEDFFDVSLERIPGCHCCPSPTLPFSLIFSL